jgi:hypothetical protein
MHAHLVELFLSAGRDHAIALTPGQFFYRNITSQVYGKKRKGTTGRYYVMYIAGPAIPHT